MEEKLIFRRHNVRQQDFSIPSKLLTFIINNANGSVMQKLHRTCKYFCIQAPYLIVDTIVNDHDQYRIENEEYNDCIFYRNDSPIKSIWVTKKIDHCGSGGILWKIEKCTVTELYLKDLHLEFDRFQRLGKWNTVVRLVLDTVESKMVRFGFAFNFATSSYNHATHEEMIACFPSAEHIRVKCNIKCSVRSTPLFTMNELLSIPYENKIKSFFLEDVKKIVNEDTYLQFLKAHAAENANFGIVFRSGNSQIASENPQLASLNRKFDNLYNDDIESRRKMPKFEASVSGVDVNLEFNVAEFKKAKKFPFSSKNVQPQYFPFKQSLMNYITKKSPNFLRKLQKTCKYFFFKHPYLIVTDIWSDCNCTRVIVDGKKYWIYDEIDYFPQILVTQSLRFGLNDNKYFHKWMQRILRWDIPEVEFADFRLPHSSFKIVTKSQKVVKWNSVLCMVVEDKAKNHISLDEMLLHLPNIVDFTVRQCHISPQSMTMLNQLPWKNSIKRLILHNIDGIFDPYAFFEFLTKALAPRAFLKFIFVKSLNQKLVDQLKSVLETKLESWKPRIERPKLMFKEYEY